MRGTAIVRSRSLSSLGVRKKWNAHPSAWTSARSLVSGRSFAPPSATSTDHPGRALARLGLPDAAIDVFTLALRRRKDRAETLLRQIRYERALIFDQVGRKTCRIPCDCRLAS